MKIYYAHPISLYNTKQEERDLVIITSLFPSVDIYNPNSDFDDTKYQEIGMDYFKSIIQQCDALIFRAFPCGNIPAGVFKEIEYAEEFNLPVIELPKLSKRALSVDDTRRYLKEIGSR